MQQQGVPENTRTEDIVDLLYQELKHERAARVRLQTQLWQLNKAAALAPGSAHARGPFSASSTQAPLAGSAVDTLQAEPPRTAAHQHHDSPEQRCNVHNGHYAATHFPSAVQHAAPQQHQQHGIQQQLSPLPFDGYIRPWQQQQQQPVFEQPNTAGAAVAMPTICHGLHPSNVAAPCVRPATPVTLAFPYPSTTPLTSPTFGTGSSGSIKAAAAAAAAAQLLPTDAADLLMGAAAVRQSNDLLLLAESIFNSSSDDSDLEDHRRVNPNCQDSMLYGRQQLHNQASFRHQLPEFDSLNHAHGSSSSRSSSAATLYRREGAAASLVAPPQQQQQQWPVQQGPSLQNPIASHRQQQQHRQRWQLPQQEPPLHHGNADKQSLATSGAVCSLNQGSGFYQQNQGANSGRGDQHHLGLGQVAGLERKSAGENSQASQPLGTGAVHSSTAAAAASVNRIGVTDGVVQHANTADEDSKTDGSWHDSWDDEIEAVCNKLTPLQSADTQDAPAAATAAAQLIQGPGMVVCPQCGASTAAVATGCMRCRQLEALLTEVEFERDLTAAQLAAVAEERDLLAQQQQSLLQLVVEQQMSRQY